MTPGNGDRRAQCKHQRPCAVLKRAAVVRSALMQKNGAAQIFYEGVAVLLLQDRVTLRPA